jgi:hypothetical protein
LLVVPEETKKEGIEVAKTNKNKNNEIAPQEEPASLAVLTKGRLAFVNGEYLKLNDYFSASWLQD